ncbi:MAG: LysM domain-containing protein [Pseudomonadota bacterium]
MAAQAPPKTGLEKWKHGLSAAVGNSHWNSWDCEIQGAVNEYNRHLSGVADYMPLDWLIIKTMMWVETGAGNEQWNSKPMQIGVAGDPGLTSLLSGKEGGDLILPPNLKAVLTIASVRTIPAHNIRAGIGYLLMRMATFENRSVLSRDLKIYVISVKAGDSYEKIAKANGTTIEVLKKFNPMATVLRTGQTLKYQKSSIQRVITSWRHISTTLIAQRYNGGGDSFYANKLDYALVLVRKSKGDLCGK